MTRDPLERAAGLIEESRCTVAFTGAGISVESGLPHFRGEGGLWTKFDPYKVASIQQFRLDPTSYWTYSLNHRPRNIEPNPAHRTLVELERAGLLRAVVTQNTDGLHQRAGNTEVVELHGSSRAVVCLECEARFPREQIDELNHHRCPPNCPSCGGRFLKPTVVLFGEPLPSPALDRARELAVEADLLLIVGTSLQVYPAAGIPRLALEFGARLCIVNREATPFDERASAVLYGQAGEILPELATLLLGAKA